MGRKRECARRTCAECGSLEITGSARIRVQEILMRIKTGVEFEKSPGKEAKSVQCNECGSSFCPACQARIEKCKKCGGKLEKA